MLPSPFGRGAGVRVRRLRKVGDCAKPDPHPALRCHAARVRFAPPLPGGEGKTYSSRSAVVTGNRAARTAGNSPPTKPIASAHFKPFHTSSGVTRNWKIIWVKLNPPPAEVDAV